MKNLLVAIDFSKSTDAVLTEASRLAKALNAKLWLLHAAPLETTPTAMEASQFTDFTPEIVSMPGDVQMARDISAEELKREHRELLSISSGLRKEGLEAQALLVKGNAATAICEKADEHNADMIILGSHGHGLLHKALLGSVSEAVIRLSGTNVMIVPHAEKQATLNKS